MSYQSSKPFTHFLIIIATILKAELHGARSDLSVVKVEITTERFPGALLFTAADAILVTRKPVSVGRRGGWTVAMVAGAHGIHDPTDAVTLILIHLIGMAPIEH
jgi:hypothetical protein